MQQQNDSTGGVGSETPQFFWTLVLAEVVFLADGNIQMLKQQFVSKSNLDIFPAGRITHLQREALQRTQAATQGLGVCQSFEPVDVFLLSLVPLGAMTDAQFAQQGITFTAPAPETAQDGAGAADVTPATEVSASPPSATVHALRPRMGHPPGDELTRLENEAHPAPPAE